MYPHFVLGLAFLKIKLNFPDTIQPPETLFLHKKKKIIWSYESHESQWTAAGADAYLSLIMRHSLLLCI
jgi:hypothetical protein